MSGEIYSGSNRDPYLDAESGVLKNLLGITVGSELEEAEAGLSLLRTSQLVSSGALGAFDLEHLQAIHRVLFGDVYSWAGQLRTVEIQKNTTAFARVAAIDSAATDLFERLAAENHLQHLTPDGFSSRAGYYLGEINVLHPFREGNGRSQRELIRQLAVNAGFQLDWSRADASGMVRASIEAYAGDSRNRAQLVRQAWVP